MPSSHVLGNHEGIVRVFTSLSPASGRRYAVTAMAVRGSSLQAAHNSRVPSRIRGRSSAQGERAAPWATPLVLQARRSLKPGLAAHHAMAAALCNDCGPPRDQLDCGPSRDRARTRGVVPASQGSVWAARPAASPQHTAPGAGAASTARALSACAPHQSKIPPPLPHPVRARPRSQNPNRSTMGHCLTAARPLLAR